MRARCVASVIPALLSACLSETTRSDFEPWQGHDLARHAVFDAEGNRVGEVVHQRFTHGERSFERYEVRNAWAQPLGFIDVDGRVFQRQIFEEREVYRGMYPMDEGVALLLETESEVRLVREPSQEDSDR